MGFVIGNIVTHILRIPEEPVTFTRPNGKCRMGLGSKYDVAGALGEDTGHESENLTNPSQSPSAVGRGSADDDGVLADQPRVVRKIQRSGLVLAAACDRWFAQFDCNSARSWPFHKPSKHSTIPDYF